MGMSDGRSDVCSSDLDRYRHPAETLAFFGVQPDQTVVEITPGGGWYAEILAPLLRDNGQYVAAVVDPLAVKEGGGRDYQQRSKTRLEEKFAAAPAQFDQAKGVAYEQIGRTQVCTPVNNAQHVYRLIL